MFKDIIVAVSTGNLDENAVKLAADFTTRFDAKLFLLHVPGMEQGWGSIERLEASGEAQKLKDEIIKTYSGILSGVSDYEVVVHPGVPHSEILRFARNRKSDLILMGPHSRENEKRRSMMWGMEGSNLERVSQKARCPVMIVHEEMECREPLFSRILVATDFSEQADCAVSYGGQLARHYKSGLTVLNVADPGTSEAEARARLEKEYLPRLDGIANMSMVVRNGGTAAEILAEAQDESADLIIMAHHSKARDPEEAFFGSTVARVAQNACCPTMSVNRHFDLRCGLMYDQTGGVKQA
ncbi:universal stress protein [Salidesulfovibrio onnuriiensis]|uniref:universal stress protein n=1 Tax=Salidesulfovibrio onnuriiensis TaxID=2583823 RepID=UPI0011C75F4A|nr:universal stress protein [Salidesulfovibrio onnuriiensis]